VRTREEIIKDVYDGDEHAMQQGVYGTIIELLLDIREQLRGVGVYTVRFDAPTIPRKREGMYGYSLVEKMNEKADAERRAREYPDELLPTCRICGCTDIKACVDGNGACRWVTAKLCSRCFDRLMARKHHEECTLPADHVETCHRDFTDAELAIAVSCDEFRSGDMYDLETGALDG
jgi:hypothetical protein